MDNKFPFSVFTRFNMVSANINEPADETISRQVDPLLAQMEEQRAIETKGEEQIASKYNLLSVARLFCCRFFGNSSLSTIWAGYILFLGVWELCDPHGIADAYGIQDVEPGSFDAFLVLYIGVMITTTGTVLLLTSIMVQRNDSALLVDGAVVEEPTRHRADTTYNCCGFECLSPLRVVGVGLLVRWIGTRFLYDSFSVLEDEGDDFELTVTAYSMIMRAVTLMGSVLILSGSPAPATLLIARVVTCLSLAQAAFRFLYPVAATRYEYRCNFEDQGYEFTQAFIKDFAMEQGFGDVLMLLLGFGARPIRAIGWSSLTYAIYVVYICWISPLDRDVLGIDRYALLQTFLVSISCSLKFLLTS